MRRIYKYLVLGLFVSLLWSGFVGASTHAAAPPSAQPALISSGLVNAAASPLSQFAIEIGDLNCSSGTSPVTITTGGLGGVVPNGISIHGSAIIVDYVLCPIIAGMYAGIGLIIDLIESSGLLEVRPLLTAGAPGGDSAKSLFAAWTVFRDLANVGLIIGLFLVVFSQTTSYGLSAYGVRKMLPKVVIAALLINMSYVICAVLVDIFNILGSSVDNLLIDGIKRSGGGDIATVLEQAVAKDPATALFAGGFIIVMALLMGFVLLLLMCFGLLSIFFLIARQILIVVLIISAPLAFISWLFPNTEGYFKKWWSTFIRLLAIYPVVTSLKAITLVIMMSLLALLR